MERIASWALALHVYMRSSKDEEGQTLVEYALIIAFVAILTVGALQVLRAGIVNFFQSVPQYL